MARPTLEDVKAVIAAGFVPTDSQPDDGAKPVHESPESSPLPAAKKAKVEVEATKPSKKESETSEKASSSKAKGAVAKSEKASTSKATKGAVAKSEKASSSKMKGVKKDKKSKG